MFQKSIQNSQTDHTLETHMNDDLLRQFDILGLTIISSVMTRRSYRIPISLTEDPPALRTFLDMMDRQLGAGR